MYWRVSFFKYINILGHDQPGLMIYALVLCSSSTGTHVIYKCPSASGQYGSGFEAISETPGDLKEPLEINLFDCGQDTTSFLAPRAIQEIVFQRDHLS